MNKKSGYNLFYLTAAVLLIAWIFITVQQLHNWGGWLLMLFFLVLELHSGETNFLKAFLYGNDHWCCKHCHVLSAIF